MTATKKLSEWVADKPKNAAEVKGHAVLIASIEEQRQALGCGCDPTVTLKLNPPHLDIHLKHEEKCQGAIQ
jgi:hypothetical protein